MKLTNWMKNLPAVLLAAGIWVPSSALAMNIPIPLGDPSFEAFDVTGAAAGNYAYADEYNPTSAWIDDPDSPTSYTESDVNSNWLYDSTYDTSRRPAPRTGDQAMHGFGHYNGQETSELFEAGVTYTFSVWAQGDNDADGASSRVFLYIYDGSVPFSEANSLNFARYAPDTGDFVNRADPSTQAESLAMWTEISISHTVAPGAPEIGNPVGVAFWGAADAAVDDATLSRTPEPSAVILVTMAGLALLGCRRRS